MSASVLAFDESSLTAVHPTSHRWAGPLEQPLSPVEEAANSCSSHRHRSAGLSRFAKFNCLALVCALKLTVITLMLGNWHDPSVDQLQTVLTVRALTEEHTPLPIEAPPEPQLDMARPVVITVPQFTVQATQAPLPQAQAPVAPAPAAPTAPSTPQADPNPYYHILLRQIAQHKRYPPAAKRARQEGLVEIRFTIAADGHLVDAEVSRSSSVPNLDAAALAAVTAASPFPPIPAELGVNRLQLSLPIEFSLR